MLLHETIQTSDAGETEACGARLAQRMLQNTALPSFVALYGDLGVGKTAFVRGFASVFSPGAAVRSPTFSLVHEYRGNPRNLFHFDMYRIDSEEDLLSIGFYDYWERNGICLVEWSEKIPYALPEERIRVLIEKDDPSHPESRRITLEQICEEV